MKLDAIKHESSIKKMYTSASGVKAKYSIEKEKKEG
jgi:hypothetical protein